MSLGRPLLPLLIALLVFTAHATARQKADDPDAGEIAAYRLTEPVLKKVMNVNRAMVRQMMQDPQAREAMQVEAEIEALQQKDELTEAEEAKLEALAARREQLEGSAANPLSGEARTLSEMVARIKTYPPLMQALQQEGLAPREYAKFWLSFIQAAFAQGFQKSGMLKELPPEINPENVKFVAEHADEIAAMQKELEALSKKQ